jgi:hypothetical protein
MKITRILAALCAVVLISGEGRAQQNTALTQPGSIIVAAGNTYQQILPLMTAGTNRKSITVQNNNATDSCWILLGGPWLAGDTVTTSRTVNGVSLTAKQASILLTAGSPYTRYYPYVPPDQILGTCATTSDTIYADTQ